MSSLNQKNRELTEENAELRHSYEEIKCELQQLEYVREKLEEKLQNSKRSAIARSVEQLSNQKLINSREFPIYDLRKVSQVAPWHEPQDSV